MLCGPAHRAWDPQQRLGGARLMVNRSQAECTDEAWLQAFRADTKLAQVVLAYGR